MALRPRLKNALVLSIVSTIFLIPVLVFAMYLFDLVSWWMLLVAVATYFVIIFLVFLYYSRFGKK
ncbi:MAG: hypothetical protein ACQEP5_09560 [Actinomycetota bacterium]